ncbi:MAG: PadR family transcriptional regulator [Candidatus Micrarchaeaceae archaeon]
MSNVDREKEREYIEKDMYRMMLKFTLLNRINYKLSYSYELVKYIMYTKPKSVKVRESVIKNDVYNTLNALEKAGYIKSEHIISKGKIKKYYTITKNGKIAIKDAQKIFAKASKDVFNRLE